MHAYQNDPSVAQHQYEILLVVFLKNVVDASRMVNGKFGEINKLKPSIKSNDKPFSVNNFQYIVIGSTTRLYCLKKAHKKR